MSIFSLAGCIDELPSGVLLERPRVLGARVTIEGDPERAAPRPGEAATLRFYTASRDGTLWSAALSACLAAPAITGIPGCQGRALGFALPAVPSESPEIRFTVPPAELLGNSNSVLFAGILCGGGTPRLPSDMTERPRCDGVEPTAELVTFQLPLALGDAPANRHPTIADETFAIDEMPWEAPLADTPMRGCGELEPSPSLPRIALRLAEDDPSRISFTSDPADREPYRELVLGGEMPELVESREELTVTHVATAGKLARLTTEVYADDAPTPSVEWEHPVSDDVPLDGLTVRFHFIVRDGRGGMDWVERTACLVL